MNNLSTKLCVAWLTLLLSTLMAVAMPVLAHAALPYGTFAPELTGIGMDDSTYDLSSLRGKWVYIDFWATWCPPCMDDLGDVVQLANKFEQRGDFAVLSVSLDDSKTSKQLRNVIKDYNIPYPVIYNDKGWDTSVVSNWMVESIPATFLIDPNGRVVGRHVGPELVAEYMNGHAQRGIDFTSLASTSYRVLDSSPSTGHPRKRDLTVSFDMQLAVGQAPVLAFEVAVVTANGGPAWLADTPELIYITPDSSGTLPIDIEFYQRPDPAHPDDPLAPDISSMMLTVDQKGNRLILTVPVPADLERISFTLVGGEQSSDGFPVVPAIVSLQKRQR